MLLVLAAGGTKHNWAVTGLKLTIRHVTCLVGKPTSITGLAVSLICGQWMGAIKMPFPSSK